MKKIYRIVVLMIPLLVGCGTPVAVKQLSVAQIGYFETAIEAVNLQSQALIVAAELIKTQAEARIDQDVRGNRADLERLMELIPSMSDAQRRSTTQRILDDAERTNSRATQNRAKLSGSLEAIKAKTQELQGYIVKMKEVQVALDAFLQSEQAGEQVIQATLKQPTIESLLNTVDSLVPKVTSTTNDLTRLIRAFDGAANTTAIEPETGSATVETAVIPPTPEPQPVQPARRPQPPENAFLSEAQRKSVQRRLCVEDDGIFGKNTRRAIKEYKVSIGGSLTPGVPLIELNQEQAEAVLQLEKCPPQFRTYYEASVLNQPESVKTLQEKLNKAREGQFVSFDERLETNGELNDATRKAIKALQKHFGVSPADGLYSMETVNTLDQISKVFHARPDELSERLLKFWKPDGHTINPDNQDKLKVAMKNAGIDPKNVFISIFLGAGEFAEQRKLVAAELGL
jgi:peptidoglycan hydrolase-like protein with peptidoglycan-binding domain